MTLNFLFYDLDVLYFFFVPTTWKISSNGWCLPEDSNYVVSLIALKQHKKSCYMYSDGDFALYFCIQ
jgi:hypothetical protein